MRGQAEPQLPRCDAEHVRMVQLVHVGDHRGMHAQHGKQPYQPVLPGFFTFYAQHG